MSSVEAKTLSGESPSPGLGGKVTVDVSAAITQTRWSMKDKKQRRGFTDEFTTDAVKLVTDPGDSASEVGRRLGFKHSKVSRWVRAYRTRIEHPTKPPELEAELKRLRKEHKRLQMERDILKKAAAFFANESK